MPLIRVPLVRAGDDKVWYLYKIRKEDVVNCADWDCKSSLEFEERGKRPRQTIPGSSVNYRDGLNILLVQYSSATIRYVSGFCCIFRWLSCPSRIVERRENILWSLLLHIYTYLTMNITLLHSYLTYSNRTRSFCSGMLPIYVFHSMHLWYIILRATRTSLLSLNLRRRILLKYDYEGLPSPSLPSTLTHV